MITKCNVHVSKEDDLQDEMKKLLECHKKIALEFIESIKSNDNIIAVMGLGSLARNYADNISDIDLGIIFTGDKLPVSRGETLFKENVIDKVVLHIYDYQNVKEWPLWMREAFSSAIILYSTDENITEANIRNHVAPSKAELQLITSELLLDLAWHGISCNNKIQYGTPYKLPSDSFLLERIGALGTMIYYDHAFQQVLRLFYIANESFPPTPKWLYYQLPSHNSNLKEIINSYMKSNDPLSKREELIRLFNLAINRLCQSEFVPKNLFNYYTSVQQTKNWGIE